MHDISDWTDAPITVEIKSEKDILVGKIEACIEKNVSNEILKSLFDCATKIAEHVQFALSANARNYPPPPPPPPLGTPLQSSKHELDFSWASTWGELCDTLIREKGQSYFQNEYTPEMVKAYDKGILHVIPSLHNSLVTASTDPRQLLSFVDTTNYWVQGHLVSRGILRAYPETRIRVYDFAKQLLPPFLRDELEGERSQPPEGKDYALKKEGTPGFLVQMRFVNVSYNIFECTSTNQADRLFGSSIEMIEQFAPKKIAELMVRVFPTLEPKEIKQATGFIAIDEEQVFISRRLISRVFPDALGPYKGGFALDYLMRWRHGNTLFYLYEPNALKYAEYDEKENIIYDQQVLKNALTNFEGEQIFENGLRMLKVFAKNKQCLKTSN